MIEIFLAFGAGLISFLSPCVLPLIPGYISYISGSTLNELLEKKSTNLFPIVLFTVGFSIVFISFGATATFLGSLVLDNSNTLRIVAGAIIIVFSLQIIGVINLKFLNYEKRFQADKKSGVFSSILIGMAFGFGWTPCIGPILGSVLSIAASSETVTYGIVLLMLYSAGLGIPFLIAAYAINGFMKFLSRIRGYIRVIEIFTGLLLILFGILILTNRIQELAFFFIKYFPFLAQFG